MAQPARQAPPEQSARAARAARAARLRAARLRVGLGLVGPAALVVLLPTPGELLDQVGNRRDPIEVLGSAMLLAVTAVVWGLLAWALLVGATALLARMPGAAGRTGRAALRRVAPEAARRTLVLAAGISLVAGVAACGTPAGAGGGYGSGRPVVTTSASVAGATLPVIGTTAVGPIGAPAGSNTSRPAATVSAGRLPDLDWPVQAGSADLPGDGRPAKTAGGPATTDSSSATYASTRSRPAPPRTAPSPLAAPTTATETPAPTTAGPESSTPRATTAPVPMVGDATTVVPHPAAGKHPTKGAAVSTGTTVIPGTERDNHPDAGAGAATHTSATNPRAGSADRADTRSSNGIVGTTDTDRGAFGQGVTVTPGDTLWAIAARHLPAGATDAQIDTAWRAWYAANRAVIGRNPNLILPGQQLAAPHQEVTKP